MMVQLASGMAEHGVMVDLVVGRAAGPYLADVPASVRLVDLGGRSSAASVFPLAAYLRRSRPDVLFTTLYHASLAAAIARRLAGGRTLLFVREASTPWKQRLALGTVKDWAIDRGMQWVYASADGVLAVSEGVAEGLRRYRRVPHHKLSTLYNPVVTPDLVVKASVDPAHPWLARDMPPVVLAVGSLRPVKGFRTLLEAFARLRAHRDARLIILGEGPQRLELERHAASLSITDHVDFHGFVQNPFSFMSRAALFVLASEREGLPGVLIQAMACGCRVVATDCASGPSEILEGGAYGELVPVGDAEAMAAAMERTLTSTGEAPAVVARASRFASGSVVRAHVELFDRAVLKLRSTRDQLHERDA
jgi:glycosyltransferase involved in cell wall biosynthesis